MGQAGLKARWEGNMRLSEAGDVKVTSGGVFSCRAGFQDLYSPSVVPAQLVPRAFLLMAAELGLSPGSVLKHMGPQPSIEWVDMMRIPQE